MLARQYPAAAPESAAKGTITATVDENATETTATTTAAAAAATQQFASKFLVKSTQSKPTITTVLTLAVAIDCEFVGVGTGGVRHMLARVSIVNHNGVSIYDKLVKPTEAVTDYRTQIHGLTHWHLHKAPNLITLQQARNEVETLCNGRVLVGHSVDSDLSVLMLTHPRHQLRDTSTYHKFYITRKQSLASLCQQYTPITTLHAAESVHDSVEDAAAVMQLYRTVERQWEKEIAAEQKKRSRAAHKREFKDSQTASKRRRLEALKRQHTEDTEAAVAKQPKIV